MNGCGEELRSVWKAVRTHSAEPVFIRPEDSGTEDSPTVIRPVADEKVVLSGGIRIGGWKKQGKLCVADVPMFNGRPLDFRQLWVNGKKAVRARDVEDFEKMNRICSVDEKNEILYVPAVAIRRLVDGKGALKAKYAEMVLHQMWCVANLRIRSVELAETVPQYIFISRRAGFSLSIPGHVRW